MVLALCCWGKNTRKDDVAPPTKYVHTPTQDEHITEEETQRCDESESRVNENEEEEDEDDDEAWMGWGSETGERNVLEK